MKENSNEEYITITIKLQGQCPKCVWYWIECPGLSKCPDSLTYKRDPPDGGYYG